MLTPLHQNAPTELSARDYGGFFLTHHNGYIFFYLMLRITSVEEILMNQY